MLSASRFISVAGEMTFDGAQALSLGGILV